MLVIWRRPGESFTVGDEVEIEILDSRQGKVKLGITAPASIAVVRDDARATRKENIQAAASDDVTLLASFLGNLSR